MLNSSRVELRVVVFVFVLLCAAAMAAWAPPAAAVEATGLYRVTLPVAARSQAALTVAFRQALNQVLIKVSGDSKIAAQAPVAHALQNASTYVQQYAYQQQAAASGSGIASPKAASGEAPLQLQVRFDPQAIDRLLLTNNLPLWGRERPVVIVWAGINQGGGKRFVLGTESDVSHPNATHAVEQAAQRRGLPVILPLMDLQDRGAFSFSDLSGGFVEPLLKASARYAANAELAGVVQPAGGQWIGRWWLAFRGKTVHWTSSGSTQARVLASAIDGAADRLAARLAVSAVAATGRALSVQIGGVSTVSDYARIEHLLDKLTPIKSVQLVSAAAGQLVFQVVPRGQLSDVRRNLDLVDWLKPRQSVPDASQSAAAGQTLYFTYTP
ncbi:DUF2066 domain-containing protein [Acidihalobacter ferrooxydans]|nr:DUF2066 domain-containing protein [Acidihalobacter ferrooxydans]